MHMGNQHLSNWHRGVNPIDFELEFPDTLEWYSVPDDEVLDVFDCAHAAILDGTEQSDLKPHFRQTHSLEDFKDLIGIPNAYIRDGRAIAPPPRELVFDPRFEDPAVELTAEEQRTVDLAAEAYLFGDSQLVSRFRKPIEVRLAPFDVVVYAARKVVLRPTGSLTLSGPPAVLLTRDIEIKNGASISTQTVSRILSDHMLKRPVDMMPASDQREAENG